MRTFKIMVFPVYFIVVFAMTIWVAVGSVITDFSDNLVEWMENKTKNSSSKIRRAKLK